MTINQGVEFFESIKSLYTKLKTLQDVGLGYLKLGQPSNTLSGGEAQRVKLAAELSKKDTVNFIYREKENCNVCFMLLVRVQKETLLL